MYESDIHATLSDMAAKGRLQLLWTAQDRLRLNQRQLAETLGVSTRTLARWRETHGGAPDSVLQRLAVLVHKVDPKLAAALAVEGRATPAALGLAPSVTIPVVDLVVCAAADALDMSPRAVRPAVVAAFKRALAVGLDRQAVVSALETAPVSARAAKPPA